MFILSQTLKILADLTAGKKISTSFQVTSDLRTISEEPLLSKLSGALTEMFKGTLDSSLDPLEIQR